VNGRDDEKSRSPNRAVENWLLHEVGPAYDALKADPSRAISVKQMRAALAAEHRKAIARH
jgi:antitoxin ParD1/3/4